MRAGDARKDGSQPRSIGSVGRMITRCHVQIELNEMEGDMVVRKYEGYSERMIRGTLLEG